jgi:hypothetical protein
VENGKDTDDFEIEITDIPQDEGRSGSMALLKLGSHFSPKSRVWRFSMVAGILSLVLLVLVSSFRLCSIQRGSYSGNHPRLDHL